MQDDYVKRILVNEMRPEQIKNSIKKVDHAYAQLLTANQMIEAVDYGDGFYVNQPMNARGDSKHRKKKTID